MVFFDTMRVVCINKKPQTKSLRFYRAKDEARTRDNQLGRLELYQLSYFRINNAANIVNKLGLLQVFFEKNTNGSNFYFNSPRFEWQFIYYDIVM